MKTRFTEPTQLVHWDREWVTEAKELRLCGRNSRLPVQASIWFFVPFLHNCQGSYWWQTWLAPQPPPNNIKCMMREACEHSEEVWKANMTVKSVCVLLHMNMISMPPPNHPTKPKVDRCAAVYVTPKTWRTRKAWDHANSWVNGYVKGNLLGHPGFY